MALIIKDPKNWLLELLYNANKADYETFRVYKCLERYISDTRQFIGVTEEITGSTLRFKPLNDLADDCLFTVTFFSGAVKRRKNRYGAPGVSFYSYTGQHAYTQLGYPAIAKNWQFWTKYVSSNIRLAD